MEYKADDVIVLTKDIECLDGVIKKGTYRVDEIVGEEIGIYADFEHCNNGHTQPETYVYITEEDLKQE